MWRQLSMYCVIFIATTVVAAAQSNEVAKAPVPDWVVRQEVPDGPFEAASERGSVQQILSAQHNTSSTSETTYRRARVKFRTLVSIEDFGPIIVAYDPSYQRLVFHSLTIERDGKIIDRLPDAAFDVNTVEQSPDYLTYNKAVTVRYALPDVRAGDVLDYAYSIQGKNPALKGSAYFASELALSFPVQQLFVSVRAPSEFPLRMSRYGGALAPQTTIENGTITHSWSAQRADENMPKWFDVPPWYATAPAVIVSNDTSWCDIGRFFAPYYAVPEQLPAELEAAAAQIRKEHDTPKAQARAALGWVQRQLRYLALDLGGSGGFVPRNLDAILQTRYGDCKDMVMTLTALLSALDIEAQSVLVSTTLGADVDKLPPSPASSFNHVIVRLVVGGRAYFVDPTAGEQIGTLDTLEPAPYGKGVIISENSQGLVDLPASPHAWQFESETDVIVVPEERDVRLTTRLRFRGGAADNLVMQLQRTGLKTLEAGLIDQYDTIYPGVKSNGDMTLERDDGAGVITLTLPLLLEKGWEREDEENALTEELSLYARYFNRLPLSKFDKERDAPQYLAHPVKVRDTITIKLDPDWDNELPSAEGNFDALRYKIGSNFEDGVLTATYEYESKQGFISADEITAINKSLETINDDNGVVLTRLVGEADLSIFRGGKVQWDNVLFFAAIAWFAAFIIGPVIAYFKARRKVRKQDENVLGYPIHPTWFVFLSLITFTLFHYYWSTRSWLWLRFKHDADASPFWRSVFLPFTLGSLSKETGAAIGDAKLVRVSLITVLAYCTVFCASILFDLMTEDKTFGIPEWVSYAELAVTPALLTAIALVPVRAVWKANDGASEAVQTINQLSGGKLIAIAGALFTVLILSLDGFGIIDELFPD